MRKIQAPLPILLAAALLLLVASGPGCINSRLSSSLSALSSTGSSASTGPTGTSTVDSFVIGNVTVVTAGTGSSTSTVPTATVFFDASKSTSAGGVTTPPLISQHCTVSDGSGTTDKGCVCQFSWAETNSSTGTSQSFTRTVQEPVTNVQQELVACAAPDVYNTEIANGTTISVTVLPSGSNPDTGLFTVNTFSFTKDTTSTAGSFQDAEGHSFDNVVHYSCYEQFQIGTQIMSKIGIASNSTTGQQVQFPKANQFCIQNSSGGGSGSANCPPTMSSSTVNSVQAYYYNFFIRASQSGDVNQWNDRYTCPQVKEPIYGGGTVGSQSNLYPMDTNFALSMGPTPQFTVGVNAFVELSDGGSDPVSAGAQTCDGSVPAGNSSTSGFVQACLGYATPPNSDGTCPYIRDSSGAIRFTYRLRRFIALYPPLFGIDGKAPTTPQRSDTVYVLDRPVTPPSGSDPLKPYTMRGPKPCPFAMFDSKGVTRFTDASYANGVLPVYVATNNSNWSGTNPDGIQFPNLDGPYSCSAAMPLVLSNTLNPDLTTITIGTVNTLNPTLPSVYVRPIRAWAPHYEEDTSFQACAPQASPVHDPPLHFAKDPTTGNVSWCSEVYPSQNDHVAALDQLFNPNLPLSATNTYIGHVRPYTSHVAKNSLSANCTASIPSSIPTPSASGVLYPSTGVAYHPSTLQMDTKNITSGGVFGPTGVGANNTCDRTAIISGGLGWQEFPLLSTAPQVEQAISSDTTYGCVMTYDANGTKTGKKTPSAGCCGANVTLTTGLAGAGTTAPGLLNTNAHLEPDVPCLIPAY